MSVFTRNQLAPAPAEWDWSTKVQNWGMLANDQVGDCVEAAILHWIMQMSAYAGNPLVATTQEAIDFYEFTGFNPADPNTDQGSLVLGPDGAIPYWHTHGVMCGGQVSKVAGFLQIKRINPDEWKQGIYYFGGLLTGIRVPASLLAGDTVPPVWRNWRGPIAGRHEILINGYHSASKLYTLVSWGNVYQATEDCLRHLVDEMVVVIDPIEFDPRGVTALNLNMQQLITDMSMLHRLG